MNGVMLQSVGLRLLSRCSHVLRIKTDKDAIYCERLAHRKLISLQGRDTLPFLQGMITNDTRHLATDGLRMNCIYSMMLNSLGRVLYDLIVYKLDATNDNKLILECDEKARPEIMKLLNVYKLRKDVTIEACEGTDVWAVFHAHCDDVEDAAHQLSAIPVEGDIMLNTRDPRVHLLGQRVIAHSKFDIAEKNGHLRNGATKGGDSMYTRLRHQTGVSEGVQEHPPGNCFPLECNADYMNGVSFHKGCYIGQELTARTHHTGVVRKRIMPIVFLEHVTEEVPADSLIRDEMGRTLGKYKAGQGQCGLALLRVEEAVKASVLTVNHKRVSTVRPGWWPKKYPN